jgi:hypothetical protein
MMDLNVNSDRTESFEYQKPKSNIFSCSAYMAGGGLLLNSSNLLYHIFFSLDGKNEK